jgi:hypothetical protein
MKKNLITATLGIAIMLVLLVSSASRPAQGQPHMQAGLEHLKQAKASLEKATADKGGHRAKAIQLINEAMVEVEKGIEFDKKH